MVSTETGDMSLTRGEVGGAKLLLSGIVYGAGSTLATGRASHELRGRYTHFPIANPAWKAIAMPSDVLLGYLDAGEIWIHGASSEIWSAFRRNISWLRVQTE